jgi:hypothetical protein
MGKRIVACRALVGTPEGNKSRKGSVDTREDNIKKRIEEII